MRLIAPVLILVGLAAAAWKAGYFSLGKPGHLSRTANRLSGTPWLGPMFVALYAACATMAMPVSPLARPGEAAARAL